MSSKSLLAVAIAVGAALIIGYWLGSGDNQAPSPATTAPAPAPTDTPAPPAAVAERPQSVPAGLPPNHPLPEATQPTLPPQSGRAHIQSQVDPAAQFTHFRVGQRNVKRIMADGDFMWVGTSGGVIRYNLNTDEYRLFDIRSGLLANGIFHVGKLDGNIVVGTYGGGMAMLDDKQEKWRIYNIPDGLGDAFIYDVLKAANGDIWVATWSGANRVRGGQLDDRSKWDLFTVENTGGGLPNDWVYGLARGVDGEVWFATEGGLARFKDEKWQNWQHADGLGAAYELVRNQIQFMNDPAQYSKHHARQKTEMGLENVSVAYNPNYIVALLVADDGSVWCGTWGGGLAHFDGAKWKNYTVADGLPGNHVFALHRDPQGVMWVGTSNGLARFADEEFKVYTTDDGLFSNTVFSIATGSDGSAWVGSFGGVARIKKLN